ncbi:YuzE [Bacillus sp. JS]|nr:YuzE [Bacillus sp. JS]
MYGGTFCFLDGDYQEFAGFDLDGTMYPSAFLQRLTEK